MLFTAMRRGPRAIFAIAFGDGKMMEEIGDLAERGVITPVVARRFALERIADAHEAREHGAVIVGVRES